MSCSRNFGVSPVSRHFLLQKKCQETWETTISLEKKCLAQGILSFFLFLELFNAKNVKKHEKQQSPLNKWLSQGILSFLLFLDILLYSKVSRNRKTTKSLDFLHFLQFLQQFDQAERRRREARHEKCTRYKCSLPTRGMRSVPARSVLSRRSH